MTDLSRVRPDRDAIVQQLELSLQGKDTWKDRVISSTGRTLVDLVGAIGAYDQFSIQASLYEAFPESAANKESLYAAANYLGVRYNRKVPALLTASMTAPTPTTFSPFSQFVVNGSFWFNRDAVTLTTVASTVVLYQGAIIETEVTGLGTDFQAYVTPEPNFVVSDIDVLVSINDASIPTFQRGLWTVKDGPGVQHFTLPSGQAIFLFGNSVYGSKPGVNDTVNILYATTFGKDGNNLPVQGRKVYLASDIDVTGVVTSAASQGSNETDAFAYKNITPALFGSFDSSITPSQYKSLPLQFPGVIDAQTFAQREINPKALTWMNNIRVVLLTTTPFSSITWATFITYMTNKTMYKCQFIRKDPVTIVVDVDVDVYCTNYSNLTEVKTQVDRAITELFAPRQGILGFDYYRSDIERAIHAADPNIEYLVLNAPSTDVILSSLNVDAPTLVVGPAGTLPIGVYDYAISVVSTLGGETAPANWSSVTTTDASKKVTLTWPAVTNASQYKIWGRTTGFALGLIATVSGSTLTYIDDGSITPTGSVPVEASIDSYYASLGTLTVRTHFSTRAARLNIDD